MELITGISLLLGLIPLWQRERDKSKSGAKEGFYAWLLEHKFQDIKDCITNNYALDAQIDALLKQNQEELLKRFDIVDEKLIHILSGIDEFCNFAKIFAANVVLSEQAKKLLRAFADSGATTMKFFTVYETGNRLHLRFDSTNSDFEFDQRFIRNNLEQLSNAGYILQVRDLTYQLSESAFEYIADLKKNDLSNEAKSILRQIVTSGASDIVMAIMRGGNIMVVGDFQANLEDNWRMYFDELIKREFIVSRSNDHFTLQKSGVDYINSYSC